MNKIEKYWSNLKTELVDDEKRGDVVLDLCTKAAWTTLGVLVVYTVGHERGFDRGILRGRAIGYHQGAVDFAEALIEEAKKRGE